MQIWACLDKRQSCGNRAWCYISILNESDSGAEQTQLSGHQRLLLSWHNFQDFSSPGKDTIYQHIHQCFGDVLFSFVHLPRLLSCLLISRPQKSDLEDLQSDSLRNYADYACTSLLSRLCLLTGGKTEKRRMNCLFNFFFSLIFYTVYQKLVK